MTVAETQREVQFVFLGGAVGQLVSGAIWLFSAALGTWVAVRQAILTIVIGGMFIFPLTQLLLRTLRRPWSLSPGNPLLPLAIQIAFTVPLTLPVVAGAALHNIDWFYPGCAVIVGAHYLPFTFLYGPPLSPDTGHLYPAPDSIAAWPLAAATGPAAESQDCSRKH